MSLDEVRRVLGDQSASLKGNEPEVPLDKCAYLESKSLPAGIGLMFAAGRVVRIDVFNAGIRTVTGAGVGDSEEQIKRLYAGHITVEPHHYDPGGHYLTYSPDTSADRGYGMVFETDGTMVTSFHAGTLAAIALVEGCS
jgi:hypothetical protein